MEAFCDECGFPCSSTGECIACRDWEFPWDCPAGHEHHEEKVWFFEGSPHQYAYVTIKRDPEGWICHYWHFNGCGRHTHHPTRAAAIDEAVIEMGLYIKDRYGHGGKPYGISGPMWSAFKQSFKEWASTRNQLTLF